MMTPEGRRTAQADDVLAGQARADWTERVGRRTDGGLASLEPLPTLPPPVGLRARPGVGQVTLDWEPVEGAIGYLVHRGPAAEGRFEPLDHLGRDVLAVPHPPYADTTCRPGERWWYAVAALADVRSVGSLSPPVPAGALAASGPAGAAGAAVAINVDAGTVVGPVHRPWRPMIGSEHLSHLLSEDSIGGRPIGAELTQALRIVATELGVRTVRAHAILGDDLGVYRELDGEPVYDFSGVDRVYDLVLSLGLRPIVELSFMPHDLAADPAATVFAYGAIISPPRDWDRWAELIRAFTAHLVERYGLAEVRDHWGFEVWNEPNLEVFWSGTPAEYLRLYEITARAVKSVHPSLRLGGPATAAVGWVEELLQYAAGRDGPNPLPVDFVSTHTYGSPPLDLRPLLRRHGRAGTPVWWTEWGVTPRHFDRVSESVFAAAFLAKGMRSAAGRIEALSYWVASDHFEELGRPQDLLHGGFGLLTVGNLRKPRFYALALLERLGSDELAVRLSGDGAGSLVEAWAARDADGRVTVAMWNSTLDQSKTAGDPLLDRVVAVDIRGLGADAYTLRHYRVDLAHSNIAAVWEQMGDGRPWPDENAWKALRGADRLDQLHPPRRVLARDGAVGTEFELPMPAVSLLELVPE
jgi:xylan 1,4-beta-xylosidase